MSGSVRLNGGEPRLGLSIHSTPGQNLRMTATTRAGRSYALESSTNLVQWSALPTNTATGLTLEFEDADAANFPRRFYRARRITL